MKTTSLLILSLLFMAMKNNHVKKNPDPKGIKADSVLQKMSDKLNSLKNISYDYQLELNYSSENYHNKLAAYVYLDFKEADKIIGFKYQIEGEITKEVFNGTEKFELNKKDKTIEINIQPQMKSFNGMTSFYNSIITFKNALPPIIANKTISRTLSDTTINNTPFYVVSFSFFKKSIDRFGGFDSITMNRSIIYKIIVDKKSDLPFQVIETNDVNNDFKKTTFTNINTNAQQPSELSWYYSSYTEYKPAKPKEISPLISVGSIAFDWSLPLYNKNENVSLSGLKGKVVLLDFWFKNCGPCIESVPHLNAINDKFKNKKFEVLSINTWDSQKDIAWFCNKHRVTYKVLMNGNDVAEKYGVNLFPTIILIDKEGEVLYSGGFDQSKIEKVIENAL